nr:hypothetical protein [uncultured Mucilaginibacter sp.]
MDEQFDKKLTSRITEVFDNYESPPADEGWLELRKRFPMKQERKIAWLWWSSAAAILLVFLGVGLWLNNKQDAVTTVAIQPKAQVRPKTDSTINTVSPTGSDVASNPSKADDEDKNNVTVPKQHSAVNNTVAPYNGATHVATTGAARKSEGLNTPAPAVNNSDNPFATIQPKQNNTVIANNAPPVKQDPTVITKPDPQHVAVVTAPPVNNTDNSRSNAAATTKTSTVIAPKPAKTIDDLFKGDQPQIAQVKPSNKELKKVNFSVYAATYINYAEGSANQVNAGAGFTSDIRLGKKVKLSTGISLAQNTLSYAGLPPVSGNNNRALAAAANPIIKQDNQFSAAASVAELKSSNASLIGLDVPINIKYEFNPDKSDTYISAGLSSGTFIDERYTYRYAYRNNTLGGPPVTTQDQTTSQSFNSFYFGKTLNLSFGTGFAVGKTNRLVIEPFVKYPLGGMGSQAIHFGAGGINLKFNFKATKK